MATGLVLNYIPDMESHIFHHLNINKYSKWFVRMAEKFSYVSKTQNYMCNKGEMDCEDIHGILLEFHKFDIYSYTV